MKYRIRETRSEIIGYESAPTRIYSTFYPQYSWLGLFWHDFYSGGTEPWFSIFKFEYIQGAQNFIDELVAKKNLKKQYKIDKKNKKKALSAVTIHEYVPNKFATEVK